MAELTSVDVPNRLRKQLTKFASKNDSFINPVLLITNPFLLDDQRTELLNNIENIPFSVRAINSYSPLNDRLSMLAPDMPDYYKAYLINGGLYEYEVKFSGEDKKTNIEPVAFRVLVYMDWAMDVHTDLAMMTIAIVDYKHLPLYNALINYYKELQHPSVNNDGRVYVIGGREQYIEPTATWDDIVLDDDILLPLRSDINSFFEQGIDVYKSLNLNPFRKILLAGMPGTGKTMVCNAIADEYLKKDVMVVYVSGADRHDVGFWKITEALLGAERSYKPAIVFVEELDAFMEENTKSQVLNVLDGSESPNNPYGTLLIATTNYPDIIDDRVLKRPGRLDRIYVFPEYRSDTLTEDLLKQYLGNQWSDAFSKYTARLSEYSPAVIREICVFALTQQASKKHEYLTETLFSQSLDLMLSQIQSTNDLMKATKNRRGTGFASGMDTVRSPQYHPNQRNRGLTRKIP